MSVVENIYSFLVFENVIAVHDIVSAIDFITLLIYV